MRNRSKPVVVVLVIVAIWAAIEAMSAQVPRVAFTTILATDLGTTEPAGQAIADFNQDGHLDTLVTAKVAPAFTVNLFTGNGSGLFSHARQFLFKDATAVATGDFNGDGVLDVVVTQDLTDKVSGYGDFVCGSTVGIVIALGPDFSSTRCIATVPRAIAVQTGDFDRDGRTDIAVISATGQGLLIYSQLDFVTYGVRVTSVPGGGLAATNMAPPVDLNGDGFLDLVVSHETGVATLLGNGDGTFRMGGSAGSTNATQAVAVGDLNGDAIPDIASVESTAGRLVVAFGLGDGTFSAAAVDTIGTDLSDVAIADIDHDGRADLIVAHRSGGAIRIFFGNGDGTFVPNPPLLLSVKPKRLAVRDWDEDGDLDIGILDSGVNGLNAVSWIALQDGHGPVDTTPPTVALTSPVAGHIVRGSTVAVTATASDNVGVTHVAFYAGATLIGESAGPNYMVSWNTASVPAGPVTLRASAFDAALNESIWATIRVTVDETLDTTPPTVFVPANATVGATAPAGATFVFSAWATDSVDGFVPVSCIPPSGSTFPIGTTTVTCRASDAHGNTGSASFTVTVKTVPAAGTALPAAPAQSLSLTFSPTDAANSPPATASVTVTVLNAPVTIGTQIAGTFNDATGHSGQSHLVYAPNAGVWWLFTLSSAHDSFNDHTVRSYVSSGPDLATATWAAASASPNLANAGFATNSLMAGGRSLGAALLSIGSTDYVHLFASAAFDGQVSSNGHIRAQLGATSITWGSWNNPGSPNTASEWQGPAGTGASGASSKTPWGNAVGISTGGFIHHFSVTMDQEVDCVVGRSTNPDTSASWTNGFGTNTDPVANPSITSPPGTTAVIDKTMPNECKALAFAPLASNAMLAVYHNGGTPSVVQPNLTNLRYTKSGASGIWTNVPTNGLGGDGNVFAASATINQNDWALVPVTTTKIYAFRRNGTALDGASYAAATNAWAALSPAPPAFGTGQAFKAGGGLFGATDGTNVWVFVINTDATNSILYTRFDGTVWTSWATVPGTDTGAQIRNFISGYPRVASNQIGLVWTYGPTGGLYDVAATSLAIGGADTVPPTASMTAPANGATVTGAAVTVSANAADNVGVVGVQFLLDGAPLGAEVTSAPYTVSWNTAGTSNGVHTLAARARDAASNQTTSTPVSVTVAHITPTITWPTPASILSGTPLGATQLNATASVPGTFVYSPVAGTVLPAGAGQTLAVTFTPSDTANYTTATASVLLTVLALPSVTVSSTTAPAGGTVMATVANGPGQPGDWVGLYDAGGNAVQWQYLNGSHTLPASGVTGATVTFTLPATPGTYNVRFFNAAYVLVATSASITTTAPSVTLSATTGTAGGTVMATVTNGPGTAGDWVGLYTTSGIAMQWQYLNGTQVKPAVGFTSATVTFTLPSTPGTYHVRFFNSEYTLVATSASITTTAPSVTLGATTGIAGGTVTAVIANGPGTPGDWVGLYDAGGNAVQWQYLNGSHIMPATGIPNASVTFMLPPTPGAYQARLFNAAYTLVATSGSITTTLPTVTLSATTGSAGGTVTATIANGPGLPGDWVGLSDASGNILQWKYLNGSQTLPAVGTGNAAVPFTLPATPGTYHVRFFNAAYLLIAMSGSITTTLPSVTLSAATGTVGGTVMATVTNGPGTPGDWVGLYDATGTVRQWQYLNGTQTLPAAGIPNATVTFTLPAPGIYHVRLFNATYTWVATSTTVTVP